MFGCWIGDWYDISIWFFFSISSGPTRRLIMVIPFNICYWIKLQFSRLYEYSQNTWILCKCTHMLGGGVKYFYWMLNPLLNKHNFLFSPGHDRLGHFDTARCVMVQICLIWCITYCINTHNHYHAMSKYHPLFRVSIACIKCHVLVMPYWFSRLLVFFVLNHFQW